MRKVLEYVLGFFEQKVSPYLMTEFSWLINIKNSLQKKWCRNVKKYILDGSREEFIENSISVSLELCAFLSTLFTLFAFRLISLFFCGPDSSTFWNLYYYHISPFNVLVKRYKLQWTPVGADFQMRPFFLKGTEARIKRYEHFSGVLLHRLPCTE